MSTRKTTTTSDKLKGSVKEAIGKLIGDGKVAAEGKAQREQSSTDVTTNTALKS